VPLVRSRVQHGYIVTHVCGTPAPRVFVADCLKIVQHPNVVSNGVGGAGARHERRTPALQHLRPDLFLGAQQLCIAAQQPQRSTAWQRLTVNHSSNESLFHSSGDCFSNR
jgi:hypothetical protein